MEIEKRISELHELKHDIYLLMDCDIKDRSRKISDNNVAARILFSFFARNYIKADYQSIGNYMGFDHSTVIHYLKGNKDVGSSFDKYYSGDLNNFRYYYEQLELKYKLKYRDLKYIKHSNKINLPKKDLMYNVGVMMYLR